MRARSLSLLSFVFVFYLTIRNDMIQAQQETVAHLIIHSSRAKTLLKDFDTHTLIGTFIFLYFYVWLETLL